MSERKVYLLGGYQTDFKCAHWTTAFAKQRHDPGAGGQVLRHTEIPPAQTTLPGDRDQPGCAAAVARRLAMRTAGMTTPLPVRTVVRSSSRQPSAR